jgi:SAM-dependent methyltransferase
MMAMHDSHLNLYGDTVVRTTGAHGADIAMQRMDDLDRKSIAACLALGRDDCVLDLGCGFGIQGIRFSLLGVRSVLVDLVDISNTIARLRDLLSLSNIDFIKQDIRCLTGTDLPARIDLLYSQRFMHYLRYGEAIALVESLSGRMPSGAKAFVSASGMNTELSHGYERREEPIASRFHVLADGIANKHDIMEPVCLYDEHEFEALFSNAGFKTLSIWSSEFGNVKGIFEKL